MTNKEKLIYLTGIIDGEGYIGIKKDPINKRSKNPSYYERLSVAGTHKPMIDMLVEFFKCGKIYFHKPSKLSNRGYWSWNIVSLQAVSVIKQVYPYLLVKKPEAELVLKLYKNKDRKYSTLPKEIIAYRESLYQGVKALHHF